MRHLETMVVEEEGILVMCSVFSYAANTFLLGSKGSELEGFYRWRRPKEWCGVFSIFFPFLTRDSKRY